jgi:DNA recombination protein RmuC
MDYLLLAIAAIPSLLLLVALYLLAFRRAGPAMDGGALRELASLLTESRLELRAISERVLHLEEAQNRVQAGVTNLDRSLAQADAMARSLAEATGAVRQELSDAKASLSALQAQAQARQEVETRTALAVQRLESIIAGVQSKGVAGENIVEALLAKLPPEWQVRDFRVGNRVVEFGLRLPNNLILPIDSKWPATNLLDSLAATTDAQERQALKGQIEAAVLAKAREVRKYIDPGSTPGFGVAALPDAVYDLCCGIQAEAFQMNVVLVSYSLFMPYLLLVFQTTLKASRDLDLERLARYVEQAQESARLMQDELEGRFARALTMLSNSRGDMVTHLGRINSGLSSLQLLSPANGSGAAPAEQAPALADPPSAG